MIGPNGNACEGIESVLTLATDYFFNLFSSNGVSNVEAILERVNPCITTQMNEELVRSFSLEEVYLALKSMIPLKASTEDGLVAVFY